MSVAFDFAYPIVLAQECGPAGWPGDVNNPDDPGRLTRAGVIDTTFKGFYPDRLVSSMTQAECKGIYKTYWDKINGDLLPQDVGLTVFDAAINQGAGYAPKLLQWGLGVTQDGQIGPVTLAKLKTVDPVELANKLLWGRVNRYIATCRLWESQGKSRPWTFLPGWISRLESVRDSFL